MNRLLLFAVLSISAVAQTTGTGGVTVPTNGSASQSGANAYIDQSGSIVHRQFIPSIPGVEGTPGVFPGLPFSNGGWQPWRPAAMIEITFEEIERMRAGTHEKHVSARVIFKNPDNKDPIKIVAYWPGGIINPGDKIIGEIDVVGKYLDTDLAAIGRGLAEAKARTGTRRVAIRVRSLSEAVTNGKSIGIGASAARITQPGSDNDALGISAGALLGTNRTRMEDYLQFQIICLNDNGGLVEPPAQPKPPEQPAPPPVPVQPPPPPPVLNVQHHWDPFPTFQFTLPPTAIVSPPAPPAPTPTVAETCDESLPKLTVFFAFDRDIVRDENLSNLAEIASWLKSHPKCNIQVEGYTCKSGTATYDAGLGLRRADAVYKKLISIGAPAEQIKKTLSGGKERPASELDPENRRVILSILGNSSGV